VQFMIAQFSNSKNISRWPFNWLIVCSFFLYENTLFFKEFNKIPLPKWIDFNWLLVVKITSCFSQFIWWDICTSNTWNVNVNEILKVWRDDWWMGTFLRAYMLLLLVTINWHMQFRELREWAEAFLMSISWCSFKCFFCFLRLGMEI
jgi:hypothetical protein